MTEIWQHTQKKKHKEDLAWTSTEPICTFLWFLDLLKYGSPSLLSGYLIISVSSAQSSRLTTDLLQWARSHIPVTDGASIYGSYLEWIQNPRLTVNTCAHLTIHQWLYLTTLTQQTDITNWLKKAEFHRTLNTLHHHGSKTKAQAIFGLGIVTRSPAGSAGVCEAGLTGWHWKWDFSALCMRCCAWRGNAEIAVMTFRSRSRAQWCQC